MKREETQLVTRRKGSPAHEEKDIGLPDKDNIVSLLCFFCVFFGVFWLSGRIAEQMVIIHTCITVCTLKRDFV